MTSQALAPSRVLIIDDEKNILVTLAKCLSGAGYEVVTAESGEDGLRRFGEGGFDLVLLDMKMPGIDGMEVLRHIKKSAPQAIVIMMTAYGTISSAVEAMKLGAVDYLAKPFTPEEIRVTVRKALERHMITEEQTTTFDLALEYAKGCIVNRELDKAYRYLQKAVGAEPSHPESYNLIGCLLELKGQVSEAQKMYRAALALDPTYRPADQNLRRTVQIYYTREGINLGTESAAVGGHR